MPNDGLSSYLDIYTPLLGGGITEDRDANPLVYPDDLCLTEVQSRYLSRIEECGELRADLERDVIWINSCFKLACPDCGGNGGRIHRRRYGMVCRRIAPEYRCVRCLIFTSPFLLRERFLGEDAKSAINNLFYVAGGVTKRHFGIVTRTKMRRRGVEKIYSLQKPVVALLHLYGRQGEFNPHVNVLIFEESAQLSRLKISSNELTEIRSSYHSALERAFDIDLEEVDVHYSFRHNSMGMRSLAWYMASPFDPSFVQDSVRIGDLSGLNLLSNYLKGTHHVRFWGWASNSMYKRRGSRK